MDTNNKCSGVLKEFTSGNKIQKNFDLKINLKISKLLKKLHIFKSVLFKGWNRIWHPPIVICFCLCSTLTSWVFLLPLSSPGKKSKLSQKVHRSNFKWYNVKMVLKSQVKKYHFDLFVKRVSWWSSYKIPLRTNRYA